MEEGKAGTEMDDVFIYWDHSNIFIEAQRLAEERNGTPGARQLIRIHFDRMMELAHANRPVGRAVAAGSVPPELRQLWNRLENSGISVQLFNRGWAGGTEQEMPDYYLQKCMMEDGFDHLDDPGIVVLLTGDGAGYSDGAGFHATLERMHKRGWRIEILSWSHPCNRRMRAWAEENGVFVPLDDFYDSITFREPSRPGHELAPGRDASPIDLSLRPLA